MSISAKRLAAVRSTSAYRTALWLNRAFVAFIPVWIWLPVGGDDSWSRFLIGLVWLSGVVLMVLSMVMYRQAGVPMRFGRVTDMKALSAMYRDVLWYRRPRPKSG